MDLTDNDYEENTDPMDMDLEEKEDTTTLMEIDTMMDPDDEDLYCPTTTSHSPQPPLSPNDLKFLKALDEPIFYASNPIFNKPAQHVFQELKLLPKNYWLKLAMRNSIQNFLTKFDVAHIGLKNWERIFWAERIDK
jgi:hypothetical protein